MYIQHKNPAAVSWKCLCSYTKLNCAYGCPQLLSSKRPSCKQLSLPSDEKKLGILYFFKIKVQEKEKVIENGQKLVRELKSCSGYNTLNVRVTIG